MSNTITTDTENLYSSLSDEKLNAIRELAYCENSQRIEQLKYIINPCFDLLSVKIYTEPLALQENLNSVFKWRMLSIKHLETIQKHFKVDVIDIPKMNEIRAKNRAPQEDYYMEFIEAQVEAHDSFVMDIMMQNIETEPNKG
jgi:hypothetical protein